MVPRALRHISALLLIARDNVAHGDQSVNAFAIAQMSLHLNISSSLSAASSASQTPLCMQQGPSLSCSAAEEASEPDLLFLQVAAILCLTLLIGHSEKVGGLADMIVETVRTRNLLKTALVAYI